MPEGERSIKMAPLTLESLEADGKTAEMLFIERQMEIADHFRKWQQSHPEQTPEKPYEFSLDMQVYIRKGGQVQVNWLMGDLKTPKTATQKTQVAIMEEDGTLLTTIMQHRFQYDEDGERITGLPPREAEDEQ
jgi:hypothetical protein